MRNGVSSQYDRRRHWCFGSFLRTTAVATVALTMVWGSRVASAASSFSLLSSSPTRRSLDAGSNGNIISNHNNNNNNTLFWMVPTPDFMVKLIVIDKDVNLADFQTRLVEHIQQQLRDFVPISLPFGSMIRPGQIMLQSSSNKSQSNHNNPSEMNGSRITNGVGMQTELKRTFLGLQGSSTSGTGDASGGGAGAGVSPNTELVPISMIELDCTAVYVPLAFATDEERHLIMEVRNSETQDEMTAAIRASFTMAPFFRRFLQRLYNDPVLTVTLMVQVSSLDEIWSEGDVSEVIPPPTPPSIFSPLTIASMVIFGVMIVALTTMCLYTRRARWIAEQEEKKKTKKSTSSSSSTTSSETLAQPLPKKNWKRTPPERLERKEEAQKIAEEQKKRENPDSWMDEMTEKITSIPVRKLNKNGSFTKRKPVLVPVARANSRRKNLGASVSEDLLFCISECHEEEDDHTEKSNDMEAGNTAFNSSDLGDLLGSFGDVSEEEYDDDSDDGIHDTIGNHPRQFQDVDLSSPHDYEARVVNENMVYL